MLVGQRAFQFTMVCTCAESSEQMIEYFPDPHPDEILFSVWARFSDITNYPTLSDVFEELFGSRRTKPIVDLPCRLQRCDKVLSQVIE